jgi:hypothetical protein
MQRQGYQETANNTNAHCFNAVAMVLRVGIW